MSAKPAKPKQSPPTKRDLYTTKPVQNRIIARHIAGESMRKIAKEERKHRSTVSRILNQDEVFHIMAHQKSRLLRLGDKAIDVLEEAMDSPDLKIAGPTAGKILEGIGVLDRKGLPDMIANAKPRRDLDDLDDHEEDDVEWPPPQTRKKPPKAQQ